MKMRKNIIMICSICILFCLFTITPKAENKKLYYKSFDFPLADQYVRENIGDFLNAESKAFGLNIDEVKVGKGIYIADKDCDSELLPAFYYPVYLNDKITYVYRIYDDGSGNYASTFSKNYAKEIEKYGADNLEEAGLWTSSNGNEILLTKNGERNIFKSIIGEKAEELSLNDYEKNRSVNLDVINVSDTIDFVKYPQTKVGYWVRNISYVENQTSLPWCAAYVAAAGVRENASMPTVRAKTIMDYFGKGSSDSCTMTMIKQFCNAKGISFSYSDTTISTSSVFDQLSKWNLIYGGYKISGKSSSHAFLIHGVDGSKAFVWNPWNRYSEWTSSITSFKTSNYTFSMYRHGVFGSK